MSFMSITQSFKITNPLIDLLLCGRCAGWRYDTDNISFAEAWRFKNLHILRFRIMEKSMRRKDKKIMRESNDPRYRIPAGKEARVACIFG